VSALVSLTAAFEDRRSFRRALGRLRAAGIGPVRAYSPVALEEGEQALLGGSRSAVRWFALVAGFVGCVSGFALCIGSSLLYSLIVGGKPPVSWLPFVVPGFELTVLISALTTLGAVLAYARLRPRLSLPGAESQAFTQDRFGIQVACDRADLARVSDLLLALGAGDVRER
jgi:Alternative complex III, ActD subunit